jgi:hypothetical protein
VLSSSLAAIKLADTCVCHSLNHHAFVSLLAQRHGLVGIGVEKNGITVVRVATKLPTKGLKLTLDGFHCFRRQGNVPGLMGHGVSSPVPVGQS